MDRGGPELLLHHFDQVANFIEAMLTLLPMVDIVPDDYGIQDTAAEVPRSAFLDLAVCP